MLNFLYQVVFPVKPETNAEYIERRKNDFYSDYPKNPVEIKDKGDKSI